MTQNCYFNNLRYTKYYFNAFMTVLLKIINMLDDSNVGRYLVISELHCFFTFWSKLCALTSW